MSLLFETNSALIGIEYSSGFLLKSALFPINKLKLFTNSLSFLYFEFLIFLIIYRLFLLE